MKPFKLTILILFLLITFSCQKRINGKSDKDFKMSRKEIEKSLDAKEKINLEKALRVIFLESMRLKWDEPQKYKGKSFDEISLELVDGKTYSSLYDFAENILENFNKRDIERITTEIKKLEKKKEKLLTIHKQLDLFKIGNLTLIESDWFGTMIPELEISYIYIGKNILKGPIEISFELKEKKTQKLLNIESRGYGQENDTFKYGESLNSTLNLREAQEQNPEVWKNLNYPINNPTLSKFNLELNIYPSSLYLNGEKIILPKTTIKEIEQELKEHNNKLKEASTSKNTLDELELTDK